MNLIQATTFLAIYQQGTAAGATMQDIVNGVANERIRAVPYFKKGKLVGKTAAEPVGKAAEEAIHHRDLGVAKDVRLADEVTSHQVNKEEIAGKAEEQANGQRVLTTVDTAHPLAEVASGAVDKKVANAGRQVSRRVLDGEVAVNPTDGDDKKEEIENVRLLNAAKEDGTIPNMAVGSKENPRLVESVEDGIAAKELFEMPSNQDMDIGVLGARRVLNADDYIVTNTFIGKNDPNDICTSDAADLKASAPGPDFVPYCNGQVVDGWTDQGGKTCASDGMNCCNGYENYGFSYPACGGTTGWVGQDSCNGGNACKNAEASLLFKSCSNSFSAIYHTCSDLKAGQLVNSCHGKRACKNMGKYGTVGDVVASCDDSYACYQVAFNEGENAGDFFNSCCGFAACMGYDPKDVTDYKHNDQCPAPEALSTNGSQPGASLPSDLTITPPSGCTLSDGVKQSGGTLNCAFTSTCTVADGQQCGLFADMKEGACASTTFDVEQVSSSGTKEEAALEKTATISFTNTDQSCNPDNESGSCTFNFCARADVWAGETSWEMSVLASKVDVALTVNYSKTGTFTTSITTTEFKATDATASDTRSVLLDATLANENGCDGKYAAGSAPSLSVGDTARVCIEPEASNTDVTIAGLKSVSAKYGSPEETQELVTVDGNPTFIASVSGENSADVLLEFLMLPGFYDAINGASGTITVSGTADLSYTRRHLQGSRNLQGAEENAPFELELTVERGEMPEIAKADGSSSGFRIVSSALTLFAGAGVAMF